jgi:(2Fe-2S) ferredoxin
MDVTSSWLVKMVPLMASPSGPSEMTTWNLSGTRRLVLLCNGDTCSDRGSDAVTVALRRALAERGLDPDVHTARTRCLGRCDDGCTVVIQPDNIWYREITPALAERIVEEHLVDERPLEAQVSFAPEAGMLQQLSGTRPGKPKPGPR